MCFLQCVFLETLGKSDGCSCSCMKLSLDLLANFTNLHVFFFFDQYYALFIITSILYNFKLAMVGTTLRCRHRRRHHQKLPEWK